MGAFIKKMKNNKAAGSVITRMWSMMILFFVAMFIIDVLVFVVNVTVMGYETMYMTRKLSAQGGFIGSGTSTSPNCVMSQVSLKTDNSWLYNQEIISDFQKKTAFCGIKEGDWKLKVYEEGEGSVDITFYNRGSIPGDATSYVSPARCIKNPGNSISYATGHGSIGTLEFHYDYVWRFFPLFRMADVKVPMTISFNYRSEYVRG